MIFWNAIPCVNLDKNECFISSQIREKNRMKLNLVRYKIQFIVKYSKTCFQQEYYWLIIY